VRRLRRVLAASVALALTVQTATATCARDAMIVFDGSASMAQFSPETGAIPNIVDARLAMAQAMPLIEDVRRIGLLTYGPGPEGSCEGINLRFPPRERAAAPVIEALNLLDPNGRTPLAAAMERAADALEHRRRPGIMVMVTDGRESCDGAPCAVATRLAEEALDLTIHVIGFRATRAYQPWNHPEPADFRAETECIATATGGLFVLTATVDELVAAMEQTLGCLVVGRLDRSGPAGVDPTG